VDGVNVVGSGSPTSDRDERGEISGQSALGSRGAWSPGLGSHSARWSARPRPESLGALLAHSTDEQVTGGAFE